MSKGKSPWPRVLAVGAIVAAIAALGVMLVFAVQAARRAAMRSERSNNLKQIGLGLHNYLDSYRRFPPPTLRDHDGRPLQSWRRLILPYMEMTYNLGEGQRWDDPESRWLARRPNYAFCWFPESASPGNLETNVVAIVGPGTVFDAVATGGADNLVGDAILAVEIAHSGFYWTEPGDLPVDEAGPSLMQGVDGEGLQVLFADGSTAFVPAETPFEDLKKFFTVEGAKRYDRNEVLLGRRR